MLKTRVLTALALAAGLLLAIFFLSQHTWAWLTALLAAIAAWEWGGLTGYQKFGQKAWGGVVFVLCIVIMAIKPDWITAASALKFEPSGEQWLYAVAFVFWVFLVPTMLKHHQALQGLLKSRLIGGLCGLLVIIPTWLAMVQLRSLGAGVFITLLCAVFLSDIGAYAAGRSFGKNKLAPSISPGKTWEGAIGGGIAVILFGLLMFYKQKSGFDSNTIPLAIVILLLAGFSAVGVLGDLWESLFKRMSGRKDSSNILPGHGGLLDRIDSLTSTLPCTAFLWLFLAY